MKKLIKQLSCKHKLKLQKWHWVHLFPWEPLSVEAEYKCVLCGKMEYKHLYDEAAKDWKETMGNYLRVQ